ncbi:MAG: trehalose-6-phosphate synthase, partial [bacterium]
KGLIACDLVGFHLQRYCNNFIECVQRTFGEKSADGPNFPRVEPFPISIDVEEMDRMSRSAGVMQRIRQMEKDYNLHGKTIGCGVERLDYTKGIPERLESLEILFEMYPKYCGNFTFLQVCSPSRGEIAEYKAVKERVVELTERINKKFGTRGWKPLIVFHQKVLFETILAMYRMADLAIVSPLVDGMNLVAKEFIAAQVDERGVLVLSQFAGAARALKNVIICNPYERDTFANCIKEALDMEKDKKMEMICLARKELRSHTVFDWVQQFLKAATETASKKS